MTNRRDFLATARHVGGHVAYASLYHGVRTVGGVYPARLAARAPAGAARLVTSANRWLWDREAAPLRDYAVRQEDASEYMSLARLRAGRVRLRGLATVVAGTIGLGLAATLYVMAPGWLWVFAAAGVMGLGYAGQHLDAPVIGPA